MKSLIAKNKILKLHFITSYYFVILYVLNILFQKIIFFLIHIIYAKLDPAFC